MACPLFGFSILNPSVDLEFDLTAELAEAEKLHSKS